MRPLLPVLGRLGIALALMAATVAARGPEFVPVQDPQSSHLGITIDAPGTDGWTVAEERYKAGWRIMYRHADAGDSSRTIAVFLKSDQFKPGKFAKGHGSLEQLAQVAFKEARAGEDPRFTETVAELNRADTHDVEAWHSRVVFEERDNQYHPGAVLVMEVVQLLMLAPQNPDKILSIWVSTRYKQGQEPLDANALMDALIGTMRFE